MTALPTVAGVFAQTLAALGVTRVFGIPGGGTSPLVAELEKAGIGFMLTHGETSAALMASTEGEDTGVPGVVLTSLGPGAAAVVNGLAHCSLDRVPLLVVTDRLPEAANRPGYHQWIDHSALFSPLVKASLTLTRHRSQASILHAVRLAMAGIPGPVHLDMSKADARAETDSAPSAVGPGPVVTGPGVPVDVRNRVRDARRPLLLAGLGARRLPAGLLDDVAARLRAPVLTTYKGKGAVDETGPWAAGIITGGIPEQELLDAADLVVSVGLDDVELITGMPPLAADRVAIDPYVPHPGVLPPATHSLVGSVADLLTDLVVEDGASMWVAEQASGYRAVLEERMAGAPAEGVGLHPWAIAASLRDELGPDAEMAVDAGAHMLPMAQAWRSRRPGTFWISNGLATMGYALPAALARSMAHPERHVVCCTGDGGLLMVAGELATAARHAGHLTIVVFDDSSLSLIRVKQIGAEVGLAVDFRSPAWAGVAAGFGITATEVGDGEELRAALRSAQTGGALSLIVAQTDRSAYASMLSTLRG